MRPSIFTREICLRHLIHIHLRVTALVSGDDTEIDLPVRTYTGIPCPVIGSQHGCAAIIRKTINKN